MGTCETSNSKICNSCKTTPLLLFCRADAAFLCLECDSNIHDANKLASCHQRVLVCQVCEQAPIVVTCKADAAALRAACDRDIHSYNLIARRHKRIPVVPFRGTASVTKSANSSAGSDLAELELEAEAASWLLTKLDEGPGWPPYLFIDSDPFLDLDLISVEQKPEAHATVDEKPPQQEYYSCDGVVLVQAKNEFESGHILGPIVNGFPTQDVKFPIYNFTLQSMNISQSTVSSSSLEIAAVPDHKSAAIEREARVSRYKEKRCCSKLISCLASGLAVSFT